MTVPAPSAPVRLLRAALGLRRRVVVHGVRYKEVSGEPLARALSARGSGVKEYAVTFPGGRRMRVRVTPTRPYADLTAPATLPLYAAAEPFLRPGMRVLAMRSGTGFAAQWLSGRVGPSGAVVALDDDAEAIRYARWRYPLANVAFEAGGAEALAGESDGAFDAAMLVHALREGEDAPALLAEAWRVLAPGGWLMVTAPRAGARPRAAIDPPPPQGLSPDELLDLVARGTLAGRPRAAPRGAAPGGPGGPGREVGEAGTPERRARAVEVRMSMIMPPALPSDCAGVFTVKPRPEAGRAGSAEG